MRDLNTNCCPTEEKILAQKGKAIYPKTHAAAAAKLLQSCPTLCDPIDGSPPGSPVPGILQARTLEWVAMSLDCLYCRDSKKGEIIFGKLLRMRWDLSW